MSDYDTGYEDGYEAGKEASRDESFKDGEEYGYKEGLDAGREEGLEAGFESGKEAGENEVREEMDGVIYNLHTELESYRSRVRWLKEEIHNLRKVNATITRALSESTRNGNIQ